MKQSLLLLLFGAILISVACNKDKGPGPCSGIAFVKTFTKSPAIGSAANGSINISSPIGDSMSYSLNGAAFQSYPNYSGLAAGQYVVTIKSTRGCSDTIQVTIPNYGPKYALVRTVVNGYCGPCHLNGATSGNKNFDADALVVNNWDRIKARAIDGTPSFMPQNSQLTAADKTKISDWIAAGHRQSD
jgi:hypothetical protein